MDDIFHSNIEFIQERMNRFGACHKPFLFGLNFEMTEGFFLENPMQQTDILFSVKGESNKTQKKTINEHPVFQSTPISYESYLKKFDIVSKGLKRGDSFLTNLTIKTPIDTTLSLSDISDLSTSPYQLYIPDRFVCFSPERFVKIENGVITTNPMKGTIDADLPDAHSIILNDFKETAEHSTIVDLLRNDLSLIAEDVSVSRFRYIDKIETHARSILQVSSEIRGNLPSDYFSQLGDIIFKLLPAGSISGAPKKATVDLIREAEKENRGYYTGVFGYFDGDVLDTAVLIRFIEQDSNGQMYFRSGGGITAYSDCRSEYNEVLNKIYLPFK